MHLVSGCEANMIDIAPAYSGIVFGISNTIANIPGFLAPQVAGWILSGNVSILFVSADTAADHPIRWD